jgi:ankyrin repeat protein
MKDVRCLILILAVVLATSVSVLASSPKLSRQKLANRLVEAACDWNSIAVKHLLDRRANPNQSNIYGRLPLSMAAYLSRISTVKLLVNRGASVNNRNCFRRTALMEAALAGDVKITQYLLSKGAAVNVADVFGRTPLTEAADGESVDVVRLLIAHRANVHVKTASGQTALQIAIAGDTSNMGEDEAEYMRQQKATIQLLRAEIGK